MDDEGENCDEDLSGVFNQVYFFFSSLSFSLHEISLLSFLPLSSFCLKHPSFSYTNEQAPSPLD